MDDGNADEFEIEQPTPEIDDDQDPPQAQDEGEDVLFGDEPATPAEGDNATIRHLREELKKARQQATAAPSLAPIEVGEEPTLEGCEYDGDKFKEEFRAYEQRKAKAEQQRAKAGESDQAFQQEWQRDHQSYQAKRGSLKFTDVDEVEGVATAVLSAPQQVTIVQVADNPALLLYALGKHPAKLAEIAAITNPLKLAKAITQLEGKMTVKPRTRAPDPETIPTGTASISAGRGDKHLEKLEKDAEASGDRSKVIAYKAKLRQGGK